MKIHNATHTYSCMKIEMRVYFSKNELSVQKERNEFITFENVFNLRTMVHESRMNSTRLSRAVCN